MSEWKFFNHPHHRTEFGKRPLQKCSNCGKYKVEESIRRETNHNSILSVLTNAKYGDYDRYFVHEKYCNNCEEYKKNKMEATQEQYDLFYHLSDSELDDLVKEIKGKKSVSLWNFTERDEARE